MRSGEAEEDAKCHSLALSLTAPDPSTIFGSAMVTVEWSEPATWEQIKTLLVEINYPPAEQN